LVTVDIKTKEGEGRLFVCDFYKRTVVFTHGDQTVTAADGSGEDARVHRKIPDGTPIVSNRELSRRTAGMTTHGVVQGGMYQLSRMLTAISTGSAKELGALEGATGELISLGHYLLWSGVLPEEDRRAELAVRVIESFLRRPFVRDPDKLLAADELRRAIELHTKGELKLKAPAARLTFAASQNLAKRARKLESLERYFGAAALKAHREIEAAGRRIEVLWQYLGHVPSDAAVIPSLVNHLPRLQNDRVRDGALRQLEHQASEFRTIFWQPLCQLAGEAIGRINEIQAAVKAVDAARAKRELVLLDACVWRMRLIHELERGPIAWLSVAAHRGKKRGERELHTLFPRLHAWAEPYLTAGEAGPAVQLFPGLWQQAREAAIAAAASSHSAHLQPLRKRLNALVVSAASPVNGLRATLAQSTG
jgi:hypothetical protein